MLYVFYPISSSQQVHEVQIRHFIDREPEAERGWGEKLILPVSDRSQLQRPCLTDPKCHPPGHHDQNRDFLTWGLQFPGWVLGDCEHPETEHKKNAMYSLFQKAASGFHRIPKRAPTHIRLGATAAIERRMLSMTFSWNFHRKVIWLCNEIVARSCQSRETEGWGHQPLIHKGWGRGSLHR